MRQKILLLLAVTFGLLAFVLTYRQIQSTRNELQRESQSYVLVMLNKDKRADEEVRAADLVQRQVFRRAGDLSNNEILWSQRNLIIDQKLATSVPRDRPLLFTDFQAPSRDKGFSSRPREDRRAYAIAVDAVSGVNYLIQPDDRVDVIGSFTIPDYKGDASIDMVTVTLLQNVKVLATGGRWSSAQNPAELGSGSRAYNTVTLELFPQEVELVSFASQRGRLSLSLRNMNDTRVLPNPQSINFKTMLESLPDYTRRRTTAF